MKNEVFAKISLPLGGEAIIYEGKGIHYFRAASKSKGDMGKLIKYLIIQLVKVNGIRLKEKEIEEMHLRDVCQIADAITLMLSNDYKLN